MSVSVPQRTGNYGPEENSNLGECVKRLAFAINTEACLLPDNTTNTSHFIPASLTPTVNLEIAFPDWVAGNVLEVDFQSVLAKTDEADIANPTIVLALSVDAGVTWMAINGSGGAGIDSADSLLYSQPNGHCALAVAFTGDILIRATYISEEDVNMVSFTMCAKEIDPDCVLSGNGSLIAYGAPPTPVP